MMLRRLTLALCLALFAGGVAPALAADLTSADLQIQGTGLSVVTTAVTTGLDIPVTIQTEFGGEQNAEAPFVEGLVAVGELTGPGIDPPIRLETAPGHKFQVPGLSREGIYFLQNIRLATIAGEFLQPATPSLATVTVSNVFQTSVRVRQLTPEEIRARGIIIDDRNFDVYGRLAAWRNRDAAVEWDDFDLAGQPRATRQIRYANGTGLVDNPTILDRYEQTHEWNVHGERTACTMPSYAGFAPASAWTTRLVYGRDAMGNVASIDRTLTDGTGGNLLTAHFRNGGRPDERTLTTQCSAGDPSCTPATIMRTYGYDPTSGLMNAMVVTAGGLEVAGSRVSYDGLQIRDEQLVGLSAGGRFHLFDYDDRSRLSASVSARPIDAMPSIEELTPAGFRARLLRSPSSPVDPPSLGFTEQIGHKIASVERGGGTRVFTYNGSERREDGRFVYTFDTQKRLVEVAEALTAGSTTLRRIRYAYAPTNRLVGRRAEYAVLASPGAAPAEGDWRLEDRGAVLADDGLPAETTFVWDPIADTLVAVYKAGASESATPIDEEGGLLRQVIHGGLSYDDPIEVTTVGAGGTRPSPLVSRLYPLYDESGAGSLQAILDDSARLVSRTFSEGAYGEDAYALAGSAVERVTVRGEKDADGNLVEVEVRIRTTEAIDEATLAGGVRLAILDESGSVVRSSDLAPTLFDNWTVSWRLTAGEWTALTSTLDPRPSILSIAATSELRAAGWGTEVPILPVPDWAVESRPVYSSVDLPVEVRESLGSLDGFIGGIGAGHEKTTTLYEVESLGALGTRGGFGSDDETRLLLAASFHAHPFHEPLTGQNYVRARWYDPATGTFLSPDPEGYRDSSNLYAFAGGDPVNARDPRGLGLGTWLSEKYNAGANAIDAAAAEALGGTDESQWFTRSAAQVMQVASGLLRSGSQSGAELGEGVSGWQVVQNRIYEGMPLEEARALIQDWDYLSTEDKARLISMGVSKTASVVAGARGLQLSGAAAVDWTASKMLGALEIDVSAAAFANNPLLMIETEVTGSSVGRVAAMVGPLELTGYIGPGRQIPAPRELPVLEGKVFRRASRDLGVNPSPPDALPFNRRIGLSSSQNAAMQADLREAIRLGAYNIRVNQQQVGTGEVRLGVNRPDLQFTLGGKRYYIEYDTPSSGRGLPHQTRILSNDPDSIVILKIVP